MEKVKVIEEVPEDVFDKPYCFQVRLVTVHSRRTAYFLVLMLLSNYNDVWYVCAYIHAPLWNLTYRHNKTTRQIVRP